MFHKFDSQILNDTIIEGNTGIIAGGILFDIPDHSNSSIFISNIKIMNNTAKLIGGGGMVASGGKIHIESSVFGYNQVVDDYGFGGAILLLSLETDSITMTHLHIEDCILHHNVAQNGGAFATRVFSPSDGKYALQISNTQIHDNAANVCGGGGFIGKGNVLIYQSVITNNTANVCGGGLFLNEYAFLTSINNEYIKNSAQQYGGGIAINSAYFIFDGDVIKYNSVGLYGGGVYLAQCPIDNTLIISASQNITLNNNFAQIGGGGYFSVSTCEWTKKFTIREQFTSFEDDYASLTDHIDFIWDIPSEFTRSDELIVTAVNG